MARNARRCTWCGCSRRCFEDNSRPDNRGLRELCRADERAWRRRGGTPDRAPTPGSVHCGPWPELEDDNLSILDLENIILIGQVTERQRDSQSREVKCVVAGATLDGSAAEAVVKIGFTGKLIVVTVYRC